MKLLQSAGILFKAAEAVQLSNGHYGTHTEIDWVATLVEVSTTNAAQTIGLNPVVTSIVPMHDGGKAMGGYGKFLSEGTYGWVVKMFGNTGTVACGTNSVVTGYVEILANPVATSVATCLTAIQWIFNIDFNSTTNTSTMILDITEDTYAANTGVGLASYIDFVGGQNSAATFGLGNWSVMVGRVTYLGVLITADTSDVYEVAQFGEERHINSSASAGIASSILGTIGVRFSTNGCYTTTDKGGFADGQFFVGGFSASAQTCPDFAVEGYVITGIPVAYQFYNVFSIVVATPLPGATKSWTMVDLIALNAAVNPASYGVNVNNFGSIVHAVVEPSTLNITLVISSNELYWKSYLVTLTGTNLVTDDTAVIENATYGVITACYGVALTNAVANLSATAWSKLFLTGHKQGKGIMTTADYTGATNTFPSATAVFTDNATSNVVTINAPTGGIAQFKGLTLDTSELLYVEVRCIGIQPMFSATAW